MNIGLEGGANGRNDAGACLFVRLRKDLADVFEKYYGQESFVRLRKPSSGLPETRWVKGSNYFDVGFVVDGRTGRVIVVGALDNLVKGASGPGRAKHEHHIRTGREEGAGAGCPLSMKNSKTIIDKGLSSLYICTYEVCEEQVVGSASLISSRNRRSRQKATWGC